MKKRIFSFLMILLTLTVLLSSCGAHTAMQPRLFTMLGDSLSAFFLNSQNLLKGNTALCIDGQARYSLDNQAGTGSAAAQASGMLSALAEKSGVTLSAGTESAKRFRIGLGLKTELSPTEFYIGFVGEDFVITAQNEPMLIAALAHFEKEFITKESANIGDGYVFVPKKMAYTSATLPLTDQDGVPLYTLCYAEGADASTMAALGILRDAVKAATGVTLPLRSDFIEEDTESGSYEILLGLTNRAASIAATGKLAYDAYYIGIEGNKIVITAQNGLILQKAAQAFVDLFVPSERVDTLFLPCALSYTYTEELLILANDYKSDYTLIYPAGIDEASLSYIKSFLNAFYRLTGASIPAYSDAAVPYSTLAGGSREILVGATNRPGSIPAPGTVAIVCAGSDIKLQAENAQAINLALHAFYDKIVEYAKSQNAASANNSYAPYPLICLDHFTMRLSGNAPIGS
ncbi:MAG: hypothetical protein E7585_09130 [Ruminococcaceae bacterium]|nr:hypothetical protein [Oscillospiraceae bacterium]